MIDHHELRVSSMSFRYRCRGEMVLDKLTFAIAEPSITGLFGRNGSGKSTLGLLLAGLLHPTPGSITRAGQPVTSANAMVDIAYAGETTSVFEDQKLTETLSLRAHTHPNWDQAFAEELLDTFENPLKKRPDKLSRGQLSSFYATLGFASRARHHFRRSPPGDGRRRSRDLLPDSLGRLHRPSPHIHHLLPPHR